MKLHEAPQWMADGEKADDTHKDISKAETATVGRLALTLSWKWDVKHHKAAKAVDGDEVISWVSLAPRWDQPSWLPQWALRHTEAGWWADHDTTDENETCGPFLTLEAAFAAIPQRLASTLAGWGLQVIPAGHAAAAA